MIQGIAEIAHIVRDRKRRQGEQVAKVVLINDFTSIPEGFTGIMLRGIQFQIVPNEVLSEVRKECLYGFVETPELKLIDAFCTDETVEKIICHGVLKAMYQYLRVTYPNL